MGPVMERFYRIFKTQHFHLHRADGTSIYSKTCVKRPLSKRPKHCFQDRLSLNVGKKYCRMLQKKILQYFRPSLSYHLSLRYLFTLYLSGRFTQVLLYVTNVQLFSLWKTLFPRYYCKFENFARTLFSRSFVKIKPSGAKCQNHCRLLI